MFGFVGNGASTCRSKGPKGEWIERTSDYVIVRFCRKLKVTQMEVVEDFESRPHKAVSFVSEKEKEIQDRNEQKLPKVLPGYSGGRLPGRSTEEVGGEEEEEKEKSGERSIKKEIAQVVQGIKE